MPKRKSPKKKRAAAQAQTPLSQTESSCVSSLTGVGVDDDEEEEDEEELVSTEKLPHIKKIWDCPKVTPNVQTKGGKGWKCGWCGLVFVPNHATRAVNHVLKRTKKGVTTCPALIPQNYRDRYLSLVQVKEDSKTANKRAHDEILEGISVAQSEAVSELVESRSRGRKAANQLGFPVAAQGSNQRLYQSNQPSLDSSVNKAKVQADIRGMNNARLEMAIADFFIVKESPTLRSAPFVLLT